MAAEGNELMLQDVEIMRDHSFLCSLKFTHTNTCINNLHVLKNQNS